MSTTADDSIKIAPKTGSSNNSDEQWTDKDWRKISAKLDRDNCNNEVWLEAIQIFENRINGRFLKEIDAIQSISFSGFAIMSLDCLLIETLQQFYKGELETPYRKNKQYFIEFLTRDSSFKDYFDKKTAKLFYEQIRNGLLHQAEIKGKSRIQVGSEKKLVEVKTTDGDESIRINRDKFHKQLLIEFNNYLSKLRDPAEEKLRTKFKTKMDGICGIVHPSVGILAYGSLITDPGSELKNLIVRKQSTKTHFKVEYARTSRGRSGAPTLVRVERYGAEVQSKILFLSSEVDKETARNILYRREINCVGDLSKTYSDEQQNVVIYEKKSDPSILYVSLPANIPEIQTDISPQEKAKILAGHAINSVTQETYGKGRDGIKYLSDALKKGIKTPLTELYKCEILSQTNTTDLASAREAVAKKKGLA